VDLFLAISQGIGTSLATGLRSFLPPLLVCVLARGDIAVDFDGTDYEFLESVPFLVGLLAVNVAAVLSDRTGVRRNLELGCDLFGRQQLIDEQQAVELAARQAGDARCHWIVRHLR